jgi:hypothetical protein
MVLATLDIFGGIDLEVDCGWCVRVSRRWIAPASASDDTAMGVPWRAVRITLRVLPKSADLIGEGTAESW